ncbi:MAG: hypothetical protein ACE5G0_02485, partial [Rhodothermales bacterium]
MTLLAASYEVSCCGTGRLYSVSRLRLVSRRVYLRQSDFVLVSGYATRNRNQTPKLMQLIRSVQAMQTMADG